jgi:hypothetical protein
MGKRNDPNPNCPVKGCRTTVPHASDPIVQGLIKRFAPPEQMTFYALAAMAELRESICRDLTENKLFAWHTRLRQPEELYTRVLYALFVASENELHHLLSGDRPNGFAKQYEGVNELVYLGRGLLQVTQPGLTQGTFRPSDILNDGAHVSFRSFMNCIGMALHPEYWPPADKYRDHLTRYCNYLHYMREMFKAGKKKEDVLLGVRSLHRPAADSKARDSDKY